ncbi:hypothetical protein SDC9_104261 [bioreactor metagenome]|uniref:Uncharacterized protein n=1 Tax=bioreactor metagenome TaxID=1076179 RepID=A0A645AWG1_9ZZZZ
MAGLAGFSNCCRIIESGVSSRSSSALAIAPFIPLAPGVSTKWAPNAFRRLRRSTLMVSGIVKISLYPFAADAKASPIPVLPLVGSMIVTPGFKIPLASASSIMAKAIRSFTQPTGLKLSSFTTNLAFRPLLAL